MRIRPSRRQVAFGVPALAFLLLISLTVVRRLADTAADSVEVVGVAVVVGTPERQLLEEALRYPGNLVPQQTITAVPKVAGRVERIHVSEGMRVDPDTPLVTLDAESASLQADQAYAAWQAAEAQLRKAERGVRDEELENAKASFEQAENDLADAQRNLERSKRLYDAGTISRSRYEEAESAYRGASTALENARRSVQMMEEGAQTEDIDSARSNAEALEAQYELAALQQSEAVVTAGAHGTVARILVDPGNLVSAGTPLVAIVSETIFAQIAIPERYYGRFEENRDRIVVRVRPVAYEDDPPRSGRITTVSPLIDAASRTFEIEAAIPNSDGRLRPGMYVNAEIVIRRRENVLVVPEGAVVVRNGESVVFVVDDEGRAEMRSVGIGLRSNGFAEIVSGLDDVETVVIDGNAFLEAGQRVRIVRE